MSERKYLCSPNNDMAILFEHVYGANFTRAVISAEKPTQREWIQPFFSSAADALMFQEILINKLSIADSPSEKLETELMTGDMYYSISLAVLNMLRKDTEVFLQKKQESMKLEGKNCILVLCGLGSAGIPILYNSFNQSMNAAQIVNFINNLSIDDPATLKLYIASNGSAAQQNYSFDSIEQMRAQFKLNLETQNTNLALLIGTQGSLASEIYKLINNKDLYLNYDFSATEVYGYLFPILTQGAESYGVEPDDKCLTDYKKLSMTAMVSVTTKDKQYYQQIPVRRSLAKVKLTAS